jgi:hypothetical protein
LVKKIIDEYRLSVKRCQCSVSAGSVFILLPSSCKR